MIFHNILIVILKFKYLIFLKTPFIQIKENCEKTIPLTGPKLERLPCKWEHLGDVLILKLDTSLKKHWQEIAKIYSEILKVKAVLRRFDKIRGIYREPGVELLFGDLKNIETVHKENKVIFKFDPTKIMFSSGNIDERIRISTMSNGTETVVDMFCGIGYFSIPIAVHSKPKKILACELNPIAFKYLKQNIDLNKVQNIVEPILGDNRNSIPHGIADRILMGYVKSDHSHCEEAFKILKPEGGVIHYHDVGFKNEVIEASYKKIERSLSKSGYNKIFKPSLTSYYKIKSYGPKLVHAVLDITFKMI